MPTYVYLEYISTDTNSIQTRGTSSENTPGFLSEPLFPFGDTMKNGHTHYYSAVRLRRDSLTATMYWSIFLAILAVSPLPMSPELCKCV